MAKKKRSKDHAGTTYGKVVPGSKSDRVRKYVAANPKATYTEVAVACDVSVSLVYRIAQLPRRQHRAVRVSDLIYERLGLTLEACDAIYRSHVALLENQRVLAEKFGLSLPHQPPPIATAEQAWQQAARFRST